MVPDPADCIHTTKTWTGVLTFTGDAGFVRRAVRVQVALRPAVGWRADHVRQAFALALGSSIIPIDGGLGVWTAGIGIAGVLFNHRLNGYKR